MLPITREELYLYKLAGNTIETPEPITRKELYLAKACGESIEIPEPITREETYLYKLAGADVEIPEPITTLECLMYAVCGGVIEIQPPVTHLEWFWYNILNTETTISGIPPIAFTSDGGTLSTWSIYGNGQSDTPPIFCGVRTGNLVEVSDSNCIIYSTYDEFTIENDTIYISGNALFGFIVKCSPNTQYTVSSIRTGYNCDMRVREYSEKPFDWTTDFITQSVNVVSGTKSASFTTNSATKYMLICFYGANTSKVTSIMLHIGSAALPYEPYGYKIPITCAGTTYNVYTGDPLRKALDGSDAVDILNSNGTITREVDADGDALATPTTQTVSVPTIQTISGANTFDVSATLKPSSVTITGHISR